MLCNCGTVERSYRIFGRRSLPSVDVAREESYLEDRYRTVVLALRNKVQLVRKMNNLGTEIQDVSPDEHQGLQVERRVPTVRNLSKTLVYAAEKEAK